MQAASSYRDVQDCPEEKSCAVRRVLSDRALLSHVARFQRGIPPAFQQLRSAFEASLPPVFNEASFNTLWYAVMRDGELRLVQRLYSMSQLPELANVAPWHLEDVSDLAARYGRLDVLEWLHVVQRETAWHSALLDQATRNKRFDVARWLFWHRPETRADRKTDCLRRVAVAGDLEFLREMIAFTPDALTSDIMDSAAWAGQLDVVRHLHQHGATCTTEAMDGAAENGHFDVVKFLHTHRSEGCTSHALDYAASTGNLELVRFLHEHRPAGCTPLAMEFAAGDGNLEMVRFLHESCGVKYSLDIIRAAACGGQLETIKFLHEKVAGRRKKFSLQEALTDAAVRGHTDVVQFLHETCRAALGRGMTSQVIRNGHLNTIRYLHEVMRVPIEWYQRETAKESKNSEVVEYVALHAAEKPLHSWEPAPQVCPTCINP